MPKPVTTPEVWIVMPDSGGHTVVVGRSDELALVQETYAKIGSGHWKDVGEGRWSERRMDAQVVEIPE